MQQNLKVKVCGMKFTDNRLEVEKLPVDFLGFIFYPESKRFVGKSPEAGLFNSAKNKVAVFVNENIFEMMGLAKNLGFNYIQLHGKENPKTCRIVKQQGFKVIKAFNLDEDFDFSALKAYDRSVDFFLFDTKSKLPGGSGKKFNWEILDKYTGKKPFFLSGGIGPEDVEKIKEVDHAGLYGIDLNSGFEREPGVKDTDLLENFIRQLNEQR